MSFYLVVPLVACIVCALLAGVILYRDSGHRAARLAALLIGGGCYWAFCEVLWNTRSDPGQVLVLVRASALGWVWIGPLAIELLLEVSGEAPRRVRAALPALHVLAGAFLAIEWCTPWLHTGVLRTSWGWAYEFGAAYPLFNLFAATCIGVALWIGFRSFHGSASSGERAQARWVSIGMVAPLLIASLTDGVLPYLGVQLPRFGTASLTVLAGTIAWSFHRYGYSLLAPGTFADEILEMLPDGVALLRLDGRIRNANRSMGRLLELPPDRVRGVSVRDHVSELPPDLADLTQHSCDLVTARGRRIPVSTSTAVLRDKQGAPIGFVLVLRDVDEIVSLRRRLALSGRLAAVGELAAGIAHEINNPLAFVRANMSLLRQHWDELGSEVRKRRRDDRSEELLAEGEELLEESLEGIHRAAAIVRDVRGLAHSGGGERELADLNELLDGVLRLAEPQLRSRARIERHYGPGVRLTCAPQQLQQVFLNLVLNAAQAMDEPGTIRVFSESHGGVASVRVEDDGCGIPADMLDRIFDPFFTTKPVGEGTGLGLGIAYEIVRRHGGEIRVDSAPGRGSCFRVQLPLDPDTIAPQSEAESHTS